MRLESSLQEAVLAAVDGADAARVERNKVVHQDWALHHADAMRSVGDLASVTEGDLASALMSGDARRRSPRIGRAFPTTASRWFAVRRWMTYAPSNRRLHLRLTGLPN